MALRKGSGPGDPSATNPFLAYYVELVGKNPFKPIDALPFCVWQYRIFFEYRFFGIAVPPKLKIRVGLAFSSRIDIKKPELYPECEAVQSTSLLRPPNDDKQYLFKNVIIETP